MNRLKNKIIAARALIETPDKWTKDAHARDEDGRSVGTFDPSAVCFCAVAALDKAGVHRSPSWIFHHLGLLEVAWDCGLVDINDRLGTTHAEILSLFDKALELCDKPNLNPEFFNV